MPAGWFVENLCKHVMAKHRSKVTGHVLRGHVEGEGSMVRWPVDGCLCQGMYRKERGLKLSDEQMCVVDVDLSYS